MLESLVIWVIPVKGQIVLKFLTPENILILKKKPWDMLIIMLRLFGCQTLF